MKNRLNVLNILDYKLFHFTNSNIHPSFNIYKILFE